MKKLILFIVPFPTENAQWNVFYTLSLSSSAPTDTTLLQYSLQGDTTINGIVYRKMCRNIGSIANPIYRSVGGLREQDKRIYYYSGYGYTTNSGRFINGSEKLLYDFNKNIGESVYSETNQLIYTIDAIDSIKIGSEFRKRYKTHRYNTSFCEYIVEGIGNIQRGLFGVITSITTCMDCYIYWEFVCFSQNGESLYKNPNYVDCNSVLKTALSNVKANIPSVKISPNPVIDILILESINTDSPYTSVEVMDIMGKSVKSFPIFNSSEFKLDLSDCNAGIYYVLVKFKDKTESHKIIKL